MASDLSKYLGNKICQWLAGTNMPSAPADCYLALFNGDPKASGTEVTTTISAGGRLAITWDAIADDGTDIILTSDADVDFGDADGGATISYVAVMDAATSGNKLASKAAAGGPYVITTGTGVKFLAGDLTFTIGS